MVAQHNNIKWRLGFRLEFANEKNLNVNSKNDFDLFSNPNMFKSVNDLPINPATIGLVVVRKKLI